MCVELQYVGEQGVRKGDNREKEREGGVRERVRER